jgi:hypothetical protein
MVLPNGRPSGRLLALVGLLATATLVLFHAVLFGERLATGTLASPGVALRWLAGIVVAGAFWRLRQAGSPLLSGRRAVGLWLAVLALHLGAGPSPLPAADPQLPTIPALCALLTLASLAALDVERRLPTPRGATTAMPRAQRAGYQSPRTGARLPRPPPAV